MRTRLMRTGVAVVLAAFAPRIARAQARPSGAFRVIVHPSTPVTRLSRDQLSRLFLRKVSRWDSGPPVAPVDLSESGSERCSATRDAFSRSVLHRSAGMVTLYWQRQIFSGRQLPPPERASDADVVSYVRSTPGAIGYVSDEAELRGVKVVDVTAD